jgi:REP element-mobilizing transposase RayT
MKVETVLVGLSLVSCRFHNSGALAMAIARRLLVPDGVSRCYHCVSRCVRRAFLCDDQSAHRKDWIKQRLVELSQAFAIEVGGYAIMGNHLHLLVRTRPEWADQWSDEQVVRRWLTLYPRLSQKLHQVTGASEEKDFLEALVADQEQVQSWRQRLRSLSWFMKCLKEPIARRANREDDVTGHFWEGRFKVQSLLDEAAVLACMVYIDLNPIRARIAATPEESEYTSIQDRIRARHLHRTRRAVGGQKNRRVEEPSSMPASFPPVHEEGNTWLIPVERAPNLEEGSREGLLPISLDAYLELVDLTGRCARLDNAGALTDALEPILSRLELDTDRWLTEMLGHGRRLGTAIGSALSLATEAVRRGTKWVVGACPVHREIPV